MEKSSKYLEVESFGLLIEYDSIEKVRAHVEVTMRKVGVEIEFDFRRFQWMAGRLMWKVRIIDFEYVDNVLISLRKGMEKYFYQWGIKIRVEYIERG